MILDERTEFCDAVALNTGAAGTYNLGDVIDLSAARDLGGDKAPYLVITVDTAIAAAANGKVAFQLVSDGTGTIATDGSQTVHVVSRDFDSAAGIAAGAVLFAVQLPLEGVAYERYLAVQQVTKTAAVSAGKVNAFITPDVAHWKAYDSPSQA